MKRAATPLTIVAAALLLLSLTGCSSHRGDTDAYDLSGLTDRVYTSDVRSDVTTVPPRSTSVTVGAYRHSSGYPYSSGYPTVYRSSRHYVGHPYTSPYPLSFSLKTWPPRRYVVPGAVYRRYPARAHRHHNRTRWLGRSGVRLYFGTGASHGRGLRSHGLKGSRLSGHGSRSHGRSHRGQSRGRGHGRRK